MILLKKIPYKKAPIVVEALKHLKLKLQDKDHRTNEDTLKLSITDEYLYKIAPKFIKQTPPKTITFKMLYHQSMTIYDALMSYQKEFPGTSLEHVQLDQLKNELHQQMYSV
jgi:hypothetical protein